MTDPDAFPTPAEREHAQRLLTDSSNELLTFCDGLSPQAWQASDGPGRWSIAGILEHLAIVEERVAGMLPKLLAEPAPPDWREQTAGKDEVLPSAAEPEQKFNSPPVGHPTGARPREAIRAAFVRARQSNVELAARADLPLKQHVRVHPAYGTISLYQWLVLTAYHTRRHLVQMRRCLGAGKP